METSESLVQPHLGSTVSKPAARILLLPRAHTQAATRYWNVARAVLIGLLMLSPLCFGAVQSWAWGAITTVVVLVFLLWGFGCASIGSVRLVWSPLYACLMAALALGSIQLWGGLSMNHTGTREALIKLSTYAIFFFVSQQLYVSASVETWQATGAAVAVYTFLMALFAIVQYFASPGLIYGSVPAESNAGFGPYVSHGNYAGLMEMLIPMVLALAVQLRWKHAATPTLLFVVFLALVSVFLSGSRAGLISLATELGIFGLAAFLAGSEHKHILLVGIVIASLAVGFFYWLDPGDVWARWKQMADKPELALGSRDTISLDSLRMSRDHLAFGVGLGAFETAYPPYQSVVTDLTIDYAHNDYAQFLAETGIWGWILAPISVAFFVVLAFGHLLSRLRHQRGWLQFGATVGVCGLLIHSFSEFNLHVPANAIWFTFLVAIATSPAVRLRHA